jgi:hypothetical protein
MLAVVRVLALLIRLTLVICVSGALPVTPAHPSGVRSETGARFHARRFAPLKALNGVGRIVSRDGTRSDAPPRAKHTAAALPATEAILRHTSVVSLVAPTTSARRPVDRRTTVSPRGPPSLI